MIGFFADRLVHTKCMLRKRQQFAVLLLRDGEQSVALANIRLGYELATDGERGEFGHGPKTISGGLFSELEFVGVLVCRCPRPLPDRRHIRVGRMPMPWLCDLDAFASGPGWHVVHVKYSANWIDIHNR